MARLGMLHTKKDLMGQTLTEILVEHLDRGEILRQGMFQIVVKTGHRHILRNPVAALV